MIQTCTPNDVLQSFSNELSSQREAELQAALLQDEALQEFTYNLQALENQIPSLLEEPSERSICQLLGKLKLLEFALQDLA